MIFRDVHAFIIRGHSHIWDIFEYMTNININLNLGLGWASNVVWLSTKKKLLLSNYYLHIIECLGNKKAKEFYYFYLLIFYFALLLSMIPSYFCWNHFIASSFVRRWGNPTFPVLRLLCATLKPVTKITHIVMNRCKIIVKFIM